MDNPIYISIARQSGLMKELSTIANNMANSNTVGYKSEGAVFSEYVAAARGASASENPRHSISMGRMAAHNSNMETGSMRHTGGELDVAIDGEGFFLVDVDGETMLTRAGHFMLNAEGTLINPDGNPILDAAQGQIQIPIEVNLLKIGADGVISGDGLEIGRLGVVSADFNTLQRAGNNNWVAPEGFTPLETTNVVQNFLEDSNVNPISEIARMVEVQRYYDAGQKLMDMEDERIKQVITALRQIT